MQIPREPLARKHLKERNLIFNSRSLPYNPDLIERARKLRKNPTPAEKKMWRDYLRYFRQRIWRQRVIDNFIVDFYCPALSLVIELDGRQHETEQGLAYDLERTGILNTWGLQVLRFKNEEVMGEFELVCQKIHSISEEQASYKPIAPSLRKGGGKGVG